MAHEDEGEDKNGNVFVGLNNSVTLADQLNDICWSKVIPRNPNLVSRGYLPLSSLSRWGTARARCTGRRK